MDRQGCVSTVPKTKGSGLADEKAGKEVIITPGKGKSFCEGPGVWKPGIWKMLKPGW